MASELKIRLYSIYEKIVKSNWGWRLIYAPGADFLFGLLYPYGDVIEIEGSKMHVNIHEKSHSMRSTFRAYALNRVHEEVTTVLFKKNVKEGDTVVDLGANIGYFTLLSAKLVGKTGRVYSFEPETVNYNYLKKNIELNGYDHVSVFQKAVGEEPGTVKLYICSYDTGHHTINQYDGIEDYKPDLSDGSKEYIEVEKVTLDGFFKDKDRPVNVIKMDIEGAELLALSGMDHTIRKNDDIKMFIEFFPFLIRKMGSSPEEFIRRLLEDYRFSMFVIPDDYNASNEKVLRIKNVNDIMRLIKEERDHLNLFLYKEKSTSTQAG
jgi:FkbM family methyltransferase